MTDIATVLNAKAIAIGRLAVEATTAAGSGHPTTALSLAHITAMLVYRVMRWNPKEPEHRGSDRLVLSEGHAVPIIYAACADLGVTIAPQGARRAMTHDDLMSLRDIASPIDGHPNPALGFPFFDAATGSLGQGLSVAGGLGAAARLDGLGKRIFCIICDGEARERQIGRQWTSSPISASITSSRFSTATRSGRAISSRRRRIGSIWNARPWPSAGRPS